MLRNARILVVEDEPLIAMEIGEAIAEAGGIVVATARSEEEAFSCVRDNSVDAALLDVWLRDGQSFSVADLLVRQRIPFLFCTADDSNAAQFSSWPGVPVITKPYTAEALIAHLASVLKV